ncbi:MAG: DsbC family protein [Venatoribacter sp.]
MKKIILVALMLGFSFSSAQAVEQTLTERVEARLMSAFGPRLKVRAVDSVADKQMLEVTLIDGTLIHMTPDTQFFIYRDELYQLTAAGGVNVTQTRLNPKRAQSMLAVKDSDTVVFPAKGKQKALLNVFTDIECGFCQKLHLEVPKLNELGITVRYLAYPRAGIQDGQGHFTPAYEKINYVWCAKDRPAAMTAMKTTQRDMGVAAQRARQGNGADKDYFSLEKKMADMRAKSKDCGPAVSDQYQLGGELGVTGTPALITEQGDLIPGYMPAEDLAKRLGVL